MNIIRHETAIVESANIGDGTRISPYAHICPKAVLGTECVIGNHAVIEDGAVIGNRVTIRSGSHICRGVTLEDDVVVGSNVVFNNDSHRRSGRAPGEPLATLVRRRVSIGANASILPGLTISHGAMVGAGTVVTHDVPSNAIVTGNPARIVGYVDVLQVSQEPVSLAGAEKELPKLRTKGAQLLRLPLIEDLRGALTFGEIQKHIPFAPKRFFVVYDVPNLEVRGEHAHKELHQFLFCLKGSCSIMLDDGEYRDEVVLNTPTVGLHIPPKLWGVQYKFSPDAIMLVLASDIYKADDYIRDYQQFKEYVGKQ